MCLRIDTLRIQSYTHTLAQLQQLVGVSLWDADLQRLPAVRALTLADRTGTLECLLQSALVSASKLGWRRAAELLKGKQGELARLKAEVAAFRLPSADVVVLDDDWGKKGRGAKILAWIRANGAGAAEVAGRFQLAVSTARSYVRRARVAGEMRRAA